MSGSAEYVPEILDSDPAGTTQTIVLAHGAGIDMRSPFMAAFSEGLSAHGIRVVRFDFQYLSEARRVARRRPPDRELVLLQTWRKMIQRLGAQSLIIGGKSLGGRTASLLADELTVGGLVCLGYPFHPPGKPVTSRRTAHLADLQTPTLICQGTRDPFGTAEEVEDYVLSPNIRLHWLADGDHSFRPRVSSGLTEQANWQSAISAVCAFVDRL